MFFSSWKLSGNSFREEQHFQGNKFIFSQVYKTQNYSTAKSLSNALFIDSSILSQEENSALSLKNSVKNKDLLLLLFSS